ncbi:MAG: hypothetical protein JJT89_14585 [Nitriliruptoraceae bacterium]|nr:hypothetical protein [Nitriliruptoraceae bacterium]
MRGAPADRTGEPTPRWQRPAIVAALAALLVAGTAIALTVGDDTDLAVPDEADADDADDEPDDDVALPDTDDLDEPDADEDGDASAGDADGASDPDAIGCAPEPCERWRADVANATSDIEANTTRAVWLEGEVLAAVDVATGAPLPPLDLGPILADDPIDLRVAQPYPLPDGVALVAGERIVVLDDAGNVVRSEADGFVPVVVRPDPARDTTYVGASIDDVSGDQPASRFELRDPISGETVSAAGEPIRLFPLLVIDGDLITAPAVDLTPRWSRSRSEGNVPMVFGSAVTSTVALLSSGSPTLGVPNAPSGQPPAQVQLVDLADGSTILVIPGVAGVPLALRDGQLALPIAQVDDPDDPNSWPVRLVIVSDGKVTREIDLDTEAATGVTLAPGPTTSQVRVERADGSSSVYDVRTGELVSSEQVDGEFTTAGAGFYVFESDVWFGPDPSEPDAWLLMRDGRRATVSTVGDQQQAVRGATEPLVVIDGVLLAIDMDVVERPD